MGQVGPQAILPAAIMSITPHTLLDGIVISRVLVPPPDAMLRVEEKALSSYFFTTETPDINFS